MWTRVPLRRRALNPFQLHTGGMCHLDADMTRRGLDGPLQRGGDVETCCFWKTWAIWYVRRSSTQAR